MGASTVVNVWRAHDPDGERLALLAGGLVAGIFLWSLLGGGVQVDDAFISYRYARNLADGHGLVFNVGERVEGFTNLLWTLLVAAGIRLGFYAEAVGRALGWASAALLMAASHLLARSVLQRRHRWLAAIAVPLTAAPVPVTVWSQSGLETPLFAALCVLALWRSARNDFAGAITFCGLATLTRPDGVLLSACVLLAHAGRLLRDRRAWIWVAVYAWTVLALTLFRLAYYGSPLPNTGFAKIGGVSPGSGLFYVVVFLRDGALWLVPPACFGLAREPRLRAAALFAAALVAYVIAIGGDALGYSRFLVPLYPLLAAGGLVAASRALARPLLGTAVVGLLALSVGGYVFGSGPLTWELAKRRRVLDTVAHQNDGFDRRAKLAVHFLRRDPPELVAAGAIGRFGFYWNRPVLDLFGLTDATIARSRERPAGGTHLVPGHQRTAASYVFQRAPEVILIPQRGVGLRLPAYVELWQSAELARDYEWDPELAGYRRTAPRELRSR